MIAVTIDGRVGYIESCERSTEVTHQSTYSDDCFVPVVHDRYRII
jgi:hypothetical protein